MDSAKWLHWKDQTKTVAERWKKQYHHLNYSRWVWGSLDRGRSSEDIYKRLAALGPDIAWQDVDRIIGTEGWATFLCHECDQYHPEAVQLGDDLDYESNTVILCLGCFRKMIDWFNQRATASAGRRTGRKSAIRPPDERWDSG